MYICHEIQQNRDRFSKINHLSWHLHNGEGCWRRKQRGEQLVTILLLWLDKIQMSKADRPETSGLRFFVNHPRNGRLGAKFDSYHLYFLKLRQMTIFLFSSAAWWLARKPGSNQWFNQDSKPRSLGHRPTRHSP